MKYLFLLGLLPLFLSADKNKKVTEGCKKAILDKQTKKKKTPNGIQNDSYLAQVASQGQKKDPPQSDEIQNDSYLAQVANQNRKNEVQPEDKTDTEDTNSDTSKTLK